MDSKNGATRSAYGRVNAVIRKMEEEEGFRMDPFDKKVIGPHDPIARDMLARNGRRAVSCNG